MTVALHHGDCRELIPTLGVTIDAVVTDPPYHLIAIEKRAQSPIKDRDGAMQRLIGGFMGQTWDGGEIIAFRPETWRIIGSALRPGGFLLAFGAPRTHHRLAAAIEGAGFVIQDCLMWLFATGFPKRRDMLKPAYEPIVVAYKPGGKRTLQVDECRIATSENLNGGAYSGGTKSVEAASAYFTGTHAGEYVQPVGRWPANICHDGSDEVVALFPASEAGQSRQDRGKGGFWGASDGVPCGPQYGDDGSAARFFFSAKAGAQDRWGSRHPTVKPVELMKWLVSLVTPPGATVLDPFAGSGTTAVAAMAAGRDCILIEREDQYVTDIRERLAFYEGGGAHSVQAKNRDRKVDNGPLFDWQPPLSAAELALDSNASYYAAIEEIGRRVAAGEPIPTGGYFGKAAK